ncbi:MAG: hypothetical protein CL947_01075 [Epsilonproteobacteria bacterium]|nr:hypothetical protein [Campylobacterota bacterium]
MKKIIIFILIHVSLSTFTSEEEYNWSPNNTSLEYTTHKLSNKSANKQNVEHVQHQSTQSTITYNQNNNETQQKSSYNSPYKTKINLNDEKTFTEKAVETLADETQKQITEAVTENKKKGKRIELQDNKKIIPNKKKKYLQNESQPIPDQEEALYELNQQYNQAIKQLTAQQEEELFIFSPDVHDFLKQIHNQERNSITDIHNKILSQELPTMYTQQDLQRLLQKQGNLFNQVNQTSSTYKQQIQNFIDYKNQQKDYWKNQLEQAQQAKSLATSREAQNQAMQNIITIQNKIKNIRQSLEEEQTTKLSAIYHDLKKAFTAIIVSLRSNTSMQDSPPESHSPHSHVHYDFNKKKKKRKKQSENESFDQNNNIPFEDLFSNNDQLT